MKQYRPSYRTSTPSNPFVAWSRLAFATSEMLFASAQVIGHRTNRLATAGAIPSERDQREFTLMGQEKLEAATESVQAVAARLVVLNTQLGALLFRQLLNGTSGILNFVVTPAAAFSAKRQNQLMQSMMQNSAVLSSQLFNSTAHVMHHGLKPIHSRATGNARRLLKDR